MNPLELTLSITAAANGIGACSAWGYSGNYCGTKRIGGKQGMP